MHTVFTTGMVFTCYTLAMIDWDNQTECVNTRGADGVCTVLFATRYLPMPHAAQFNATAYPSAQPVSGLGGRGSAWFVDTPAGRAVLKQYRRGGHAAWVSVDSYLYLGQLRVRSFAEYRLLAFLRGQQLPVPEPLAAFCLRTGLTYRAALLTRRIPAAQSFVEHVRQGNAPWADAGRLIARFHRAGVYHADLNANNILCNAEGLHLIDWDKGRWYQNPGRWTRAVLQRLQRSIDKECAWLSDAERRAGFASLLAAYDETMP